MGQLNNLAPPLGAIGTSNLFSNGAATPDKKVMRIAYLTTKYPSVSHTFIRRELHEMERRGHSVLRLAVRRSDAPLVDPLDQEEAQKCIHCLSQPLHIHLFSLLRTFISAPLRFLVGIRVAIKMGSLSDRGIIKHLIYLIEACTLLVIVKKNNIDHIHVHFGTNSTAVARLIKLCGGPGYSFTVHGPTEFDSAIGFDLEGKINDASFVLAITDYCSAQLRRWCPPQQWSKIHIIHCTVGDDFFQAAAPLDPQSTTFTCVGRLSPQKGQLVLVDAFAQLLDEGHQAHLIFVGDGELRDMIEERIQDHNVESHVTITGYVSEAEVRSHISTSRAMVLPSFAEGLPMVIMEAFAVGRPVISTYIAGIPELVVPEKNGWLVAAGNVRDLVDALRDALQTSPETLTTMASHGRDLTYKYHRTITEGEKLEEILQEYVNVVS